MKKASVMISLLVGVLILVFTVEPCLSQAEKIYFEGKRCRTEQNKPTPQISGCRYKVDGQDARWDVITNSTLVTGKWYNWDTKVRREILSYTAYDEFGGSSYITNCVPSELPPSYCVAMPKISCLELVPAKDLGAGTTFGPFTLEPEAGGLWTGYWDSIWHPDGTRTMHVEAKGRGGLIEGMSLHVNVLFSLVGNCNAPFNGWIVKPAMGK